MKHRLMVLTVRADKAPTRCSHSPETSQFCLAVIDSFASLQRVVSAKP